MKRLTLFGAIVCAVTAVFTGCNPVEEPAPRFTSAMDGDLNVPACETRGVITYSLENPAEDGNILAKSNAEEWIGGYDYSKDGEISFDIAANDIQEHILTAPHWPKSRSLHCRANRRTHTQPHP